MRVVRMLLENPDNYKGLYWDQADGVFIVWDDKLLVGTNVLVVNGKVKNRIMNISSLFGEGRLRFSEVTYHKEIVMNYELSKELKGWSSLKELGEKLEKKTDDDKFISKIKKMEAKLAGEDYYRGKVSGRVFEKGTVVTFWNNAKKVLTKYSLLDKYLLPFLKNRFTVEMNPTRDMNDNFYRGEGHIFETNKKEFYFILKDISEGVGEGVGYEEDEVWGFDDERSKELRDWLRSNILSRVGIESKERRDKNIGLLI